MAAEGGALAGGAPFAFEGADSDEKLATPFRQRQRYLACMMGIVKKQMGKQPCSGNRAKERSINWFQPILFRAGFHEVSKHLESSLNQLFAIADAILLARIDLTYRRVFYFSRYAKKLTE